MALICQSNILVDQTCQARLADFGHSIFTDLTIPNSYTQGGTVRWMSPELFDPETQDNCPTEYSDCYALGMVIYEVLSLRIPFYQDKDLAIAVKIFRGDRPERPQEAEGVWFVDDVWEVLECCWAPGPQDRPSIEDVLRCLEETSRFPVSQPSRLLMIPPTADSATEGWSGQNTAGNPDPDGEHSPSQAMASYPSVKLNRGDHSGIASWVPATAISKIVPAPIWLNEVINLDWESPDASHVLTTAFEAEDYLDCIENLRERGIDPISYINSLDKVCKILILIRRAVFLTF